MEVGGCKYPSNSYQALVALVYTRYELKITAAFWKAKLYVNITQIIPHRIHHIPNCHLIVHSIRWNRRQKLHPSEHFVSHENIIGKHGDTYVQHRRLSARIKQNVRYVGEVRLNRSSQESPFIRFMFALPVVPDLVHHLNNMTWISTLPRVLGCGIRTP